MAAMGDRSSTSPGHAFDPGWVSTATRWVSRVAKPLLKAANYLGVFSIEEKLSDFLEEFLVSSTEVPC